jgi:hypothetical protein
LCLQQGYATHARPDHRLSEKSLVFQMDKYVYRGKALRQCDTVAGIFPNDRVGFLVREQARKTPIT